MEKFRIGRYKIFRSGKEEPEYSDVVIHNLATIENKSQAVVSYYDKQHRKYTQILPIISYDRMKQSYAIFIGDDHYIISTQSALPEHTYFKVRHRYYCGIWDYLVTAICISEEIGEKLIILDDTYVGVAEQTIDKTEKVQFYDRYGNIKTLYATSTKRPKDAEF